MKKLVGCLFCVFSLYGESPVNLDYAACADSSLEALLEFVNVSVLAGNSSGINPHAERLRYIEYISAEVIAQKMKTSGDKLLFVTSASMANNIAILGVAKKHPGCHMITTKIEHKSVLNIFKYLETQGYRVTYLNVDRNGLIDMNQLQKSISSDTKLISIQMVNSEIGALQDMDAIGKLARQHNVLFHSDASQAFGKYDIDVDKIGIDLLTVSGYKIGAPKGIAALYVKDADKMLEPVLYGSGNPLFSGIWICQECSSRLVRHNFIRSGASRTLCHPSVPVGGKPSDLRFFRCPPTYGMQSRIHRGKQQDRVPDFRLSPA